MSRTSVKESHDQNNNCYTNLNLLWNQHQWELGTETGLSVGWWWCTVRGDKLLEHNTQSSVFTRTQTHTFVWDPSFKRKIHICFSVALNVTSFTFIFPSLSRLICSSLKIWVLIIKLQQNTIKGPVNRTAGGRNAGWMSESSSTHQLRSDWLILSRPPHI